MNAVNVLPAILSFFFPGVGQLVQGRLHAFIGFVILWIALWMVFLGWIIHFLACYEAAIYDPPAKIVPKFKVDENGRPTSVEFD